MSYTAVFRRYEIKYLLSEAQYAALLPAIQAHMEPDRHGLTTIQNLYFDTEQYRLIRRSIEKPVYKEKLRLLTQISFAVIMICIWIEGLEISLF